MSEPEDEWRPGSFTKNFSWGQERGLKQLHDSIRIGFGNELEDVPRRVFRKRVADQGRPDYIPINFFLFNRPRRGEDYLVVDELVFQALTARHSSRFDKLALLAFNLSYVGRFKGAKDGQRRPALWAHHYVRDRVAGEMDWDTRRVSADDIERFVEGDPRYRAEGARKLATNLNHLYRIGRLADFGAERVERWWVDSLFLALDRIAADRELDRLATPARDRVALLNQSGFQDLAGRRSLEKQLATGHLVRLYDACGGIRRFSDEAVRERTEATVQDLSEWANPNDDDPGAAVHPTNPRVLKTIPSVCAMLAMYAGFDVLTALQLREFDEAEYIRRRTREALDRLRAEGVEPTMSAEDLLRLTRER